MRPVVLVGAGPRVVVTIARSLQRRGIPSVVALYPGTSRWAPSRAVARMVRLPSDPDRCGDALLALVRETNASWVVPCTDAALAQIGQLHGPLSELTTPAFPPPGIVARVLDKRETLRVAEAVGVPIPQGFQLPDRAALQAQLAALPFPLIAKPADRSVRGGPDFKTRRFDAAPELEQAFAGEARFGAPLLFQEYCEGEGVGVELLFDGRDAIAVFQHRRLRELPVSGGVAVSAVSEAPDPLLVEHAVRLLRALEWRGVAMVEFRRDTRTGHSVLMEVNGRFWGSIALPVHAGVDFPFLAWQLDHGQRPMPPASYRVGLRMRWGSGDLLRIEQSWRTGGLGATDAAAGAPSGGTRRTIAEFVRDSRPGLRPALWSWRDPVPAAAEATSALRTLGGTALRRAVRRLLPESWLETLTLARRLGGARGAELLRLRLARGVGRRYRLPRGARPGVVLFVCHGNIMRSAVAAAMLRARLAAVGHDAPLVLSAGVHAKPGLGAHPHVQAAARELGIDLSDHAAQGLSPALVERADWIFTMDDVNAACVLAQYPGARGKLYPLGGITVGAYRGSQIADPYTGDAEASRRMLTIVARCIAVVEQLLGPPPAPRQPVPETTTTSAPH